MEKKHMNILVVDDDKGIGQMLTMVLERNGYKVYVSENPEDAEKNIISYNIDVVLLDVLIAGINGIDVCTRLKRDETTKKTPKLMMSALHDAGIRCKAAGANDFIDKPFKIPDLLGKLKMAY